MASKFKSCVQKFASDLDGSLTVWNTVSMIGLLSIGGMAVDTSNAWRVKTLLQNTAEASALAAALHFDDPIKARDTALDFAKRNMPQNINGTVVRPQDIQFGTFDRATGTFTPTDLNPDSVRVLAGRSQDRSNVVRTYLLRMAGVDDLEIGGAAIAFPRWSNSDAIDCSGGRIMSTGILDTGDSNDFVDGVCVHGEMGLVTGSDNLFDASVKLSTNSLLDVFFGVFRAGSVDPEDLLVEQSLDPKILPSIDAKFDELWSDLWETEDATYSSAMLPEFIYAQTVTETNSADTDAGVVNPLPTAPNGTGDDDDSAANDDDDDNDDEGDDDDRSTAMSEAPVVRIDQPTWVARPGELTENTVYVVNGDVTFEPDTSFQNIAVIAKGSISVDSGTANFSNVFFFGEGDLNFSGETNWGDRNNYCDSGEYNSYLFSKNHLELGANLGTASAHGLVVAARSFDANGGLGDAGGIYIEVDSLYTDLGGGIKITNSCDNELTSFDETTGWSEQPRVIGSSLRY